MDLVPLFDSVLPWPQKPRADNTVYHHIISAARKALCRRQKGLGYDLILLL